MQQLERLKNQSENKLSLTKRLEQRAGRVDCVLLDVSGSMGLLTSSGKRRIDVLWEAIESIGPLDQPVFWFNHRFGTWSREKVEPDGSTDMALAFMSVKSKGFRRLLIVTDGEPDSQTRALEAAEGLRISAIYCGDGEPPSFLQELVRRTNGKFGVEHLDDPKRLGEVIKGYLQ